MRQVTELALTCLFQDIIYLLLLAVFLGNLAQKDIERAIRSVSGVPISRKESAWAFWRYCLICGVGCFCNGIAVFVAVLEPLVSIHLNDGCLVECSALILFDARNYV
jgi:hypothetical protein